MSTRHGGPVVILLVEDDRGHAKLIQRNLESLRIANRLIHVVDGQAALDYLYRRAEFSSPELSPRPGVILLDLRLPKVDGLRVLETIKSDPDLSRIPVVVLTTSGAEADVAKAYEKHASSYLVKPVDFAKFKELMESFGYYWLVWNKLPD